MKIFKNFKTKKATQRRNCRAKRNVAPTKTTDTYSGV